MKNKRLIHKKRFLTYTLICLVFIGLLAVIFVRYEYDQGLKPVSSSSNTIIITIPKGASLKQIAAILKDNNLIRSALAFQEYVDAHNLRSHLEAGTYALSPNQGVITIVAILTNGRVSLKLVTILPGQTISQIRATLINSGFSPDTVDTALNAGNYSKTPVLSFKPSGYGLDGLIYPDSYQKDSGTTPTQIVQEALDEMGGKLNPSLQASYAAEGLSVYQAIILASIIQKEVPDYSTQQEVAQVFFNRLKQGMPLQSNVTAIFAKSIGNQAYNTYNQPGLPPSPIANVDIQALKAVANPIPSSHLYFVTGKDGITRFADTIDQHNANISQFGQAAE
ncbi:MAG: endolytic transglycosylase MltG [Candidatus Saccharibacteria bacterium]